MEKRERERERERETEQEMLRVPLVATQMNAWTSLLLLLAVTNALRLSLRQRL